MFRLAILTISTSGYQGQREDTSGEAIKDRDGDLSSGLPDVGSRQVAESVMGVTSEVRTGTRGASQFARKRRSVEADMRRALSSGDAVQVGLRWSTDSKGKDGYHALSVTGFDDQYVYLRNPHGSEDSGKQIVGHDSQAAVEPFQPAYRPGFPDIQDPEADECRSHPRQGLGDQHTGGPHPDEFIPDGLLWVGVGDGGHFPGSPDPQQEPCADEYEQPRRIASQRSPPVNCQSQQTAGSCGRQGKQSRA